MSTNLIAAILIGFLCAKTISMTHTLILKNALLQNHPHTQFVSLILCQVAKIVIFSSFSLSILYWNKDLFISFLLASTLQIITKSVIEKLVKPRKILDMDLAS
ncbi:MAG: hypothetical protein VX112_01080 [Pseudomonadota bacterium]|nr:hypothetical protein [Pseudomonadota bacterium]